MRFAPAIGGEQLLFDFDKFSSITASVYADSPYSLAEVLEVFRYYFEQYEAYTALRTRQYALYRSNASSAKCRISTRRIRSIPRWT